ncbi:hypothetical protein ACFVAD_19535 [Sutcliffiella sp. NPDC057660]|uniref:hypothetical protein n=1 Tax=Sutcliffiella sp. NPDC057660 TaxID=3346199 RepID=UPI0036B7D2C4
MYKKVRNVIRYRDVALICLFASAFFLPLSRWSRTHLSTTGTIIGIILLLIFLVICLVFWRCPNCRKRLPLRFEKDDDFNYTYVCPHCQARFFDDGTMEEKKEENRS